MRARRWDPHHGECCSYAFMVSFSEKSKHGGISVEALRHRILFEPSEEFDCVDASF